MRATRIHFQWSPEFAANRFKTGVSLHSHTLHSRETLDCLYRAASHSSVLHWAIRHCEARYRTSYRGALDLARGWWTPPLAPLDAYNVEADQIRSIGLNPLVSLTDHDDIEAPMSLQAIDATRRVPVSVEWTVPFRNTVVHLGVHHLPSLGARTMMGRMRQFTAHPDESALREILAGMHDHHGTLIVLNHPLWDEMGVGESVHRKAVLGMLGGFREYIHAVELNGLRPWRENTQAIMLAQNWSKPVVSGGDRHALEPNATINLTSATKFSEFVAEIRGGHSTVLLASQYRRAHTARIFQDVLDVLGTCENHGLGWREWPDRVFYEFEDGAVRSLAQIWGSRPPSAAAILAGAMRLARLAPFNRVAVLSSGRRALHAGRGDIRPGTQPRSA